MFKALRRRQGNSAKNIFGGLEMRGQALLKSGRKIVKKTENVTVKVTNYVAG